MSIAPNLLNNAWMDLYNDCLLEVDNIKDFQSFLNENAEVTLQNFAHPEDALYVFGRATQTPVAPDHAVSVKIDTIKPGCLWAHQTCAIVLYDRLIKS